MTAGGALVDAADRGALTIDDRVVERVAAYAVTTVAHAAAAPRRVLGVSMGQARPEDPARTVASVHGSTAMVEATIAVAWPQPIRQVTDELRQRVRDEVRTMTGVEVDRIDIEVVSMDIPAPSTPRVR